MEREVIITRRFRKNTLQVHQYLLKNFSSNTADAFLIRLENRIDFISNNPAVGKISAKRKNVRSILFTLHNQLFYRIPWWNYWNPVSFWYAKGSSEKAVLNWIRKTIESSACICCNLISTFIYLNNFTTNQSIFVLCDGHLCALIIYCESAKWYVFVKGMIVFLLPCLASNKKK